MTKVATARAMLPRLIRFPGWDFSGSSNHDERPSRAALNRDGQPRDAQQLFAQRQPQLLQNRLAEPPLAHGISYQASALEEGLRGSDRRLVNRDASYRVQRVAQQPLQEPRSSLRSRPQPRCAVLQLQRPRHCSRHFQIPL